MQQLTVADALLFAAIFVGLFVLRIIAATFVFMWILPTGDHCPNCDSITIRVHSKWWNMILPWFRTRWCYECGWDGFMRPGAGLSSPVSAELSHRP